MVIIIVYAVIQSKNEQKDTNKDENKVTTEVIKNNNKPNEQLLSQEMIEMIKKIDDLEQKNAFVSYLIKTKEEDVKDTNLSSEEKTLLESLITLRKNQKTILEERIALVNYLKTLTEEIQSLDEQIKNSKTSEEKYRLKGEQNKKEQECLKLKETEKMIDEKEALIPTIDNLTKQINATPATETDKKNTLTTDKTNKETRKTTIQTQIDKYVKKYYLDLALKQVEAELKIPFINEEITAKLKEFKTMKENQLKTLESS